MIEFLTYDLKVAALIAVFYMFYRLMLSRETFHRVNRIVLLTTAVASFVLPLCVITLHETITMDPVPTVAADLQSAALEYQDLQSEPQIPLWQIVLLTIFILGMVATLAHTLWSLFRILKLIRNSEQHPQQDGTTICVTGNADLSPFSWMHYIVMNRSDYEAADPAILAHERGHIRLRHSWDLLLVDTLTALQWFNPAIWMLRQDLRAIHEYEADGEVLSLGINARQYQYLLITKAASIGGYSLANGISHSTLKNRIHMMLHKKSSSRRLLKLIALVPIVGIALALNAKTVTDVVYTNDAAKELVKSEFKADTIQTPNPPLSNDGAASFKTLPYIIEGEEADGDAKDKVYDVVEEMPQFPGGIGKMMEYLAVNLRYPKEAEEKGLQGRVIANFVIEPDGSITNAKVVKPLDPALDAEALRLVNAMPKWTPGKQDGVPMRVKYTIPITFRLDNGPAIPALKEKPANQGPEVVAMAHRSETAKSGTQEEQPLVFVDNKEVPFEQLGKIDPKTIDHMDVLKGKSGTEKYGAKGKNGVVLITTKK